MCGSGSLPLASVDSAARDGAAAARSRQNAPRLRAGRAPSSWPTKTGSAALALDIGAAARLTGAARIFESSTMTVVECPNCFTRMNAPDRLLGTSVPCLACRNRFRTPGPARRHQPVRAAEPFPSAETETYAVDNAGRQAWSGGRRAATRLRSASESGPQRRMGVRHSVHGRAAAGWHIRPHARAGGRLGEVRVPDADAELPPLRRHRRG